MSDNSTADTHSVAKMSGDSASGLWSDYTKRSPNFGSIIVKNIILAFAVSSETAIQGSSWLDRRRRDESTVTWAIRSVIGRPISRAEALSIVQKILERAERERLEIAEAEAMRGFQWEDEI